MSEIVLEARNIVRDYHLGAACSASPRQFTR